MEMLVIEGGCSLKGEVTISGSKNSALPVLIASLLCDGKSSIRNVPNLADTRFLLSLLGALGPECHFENNEVIIDATCIGSHRANYEMVRKMRASVLVLAPLLARLGRAEVSLPGGCAIGSRPVDIHLQGLECLGASIEVSEGYIHAELKKGHFIGADFQLPMPSVGATEQLIMAAVLAQGVTTLSKVAREPEIVELCAALNKAGANIEGAGTSTLRISGVSSLCGLDYSIKADRIEAGTFIAIAGATGSSIKLKNICGQDISNITERFASAGLRFKSYENSCEGLIDLEVIPCSRLKATDIETGAYPGFPTDMQAQFMAAMALAEGTSVIYERIFENRMMHVPELGRMGANIKVEKGIAKVNGIECLSGAQVMATDLRASASLVIAALAAHGTSEIRRVYHLDRGYESLEKKLEQLGARVKRVTQI
ncbi:MAG: UDP-N-acetylglucosamine 1-carboxyvinyltransferase [Myxococcales bacterium]|nr:UDP-N-acetylglucosamine 1-carboxyvinyltransferase [Myxococcales bacterium]USN50981.1 MAG: UDP-N-acetylglucosamine 1-carboxyvinyltransferase [Myxococcales bacterium]